jgi:hypothetical protein
VMRTFAHRSALTSPPCLTARLGSGDHG